MSKFFETEEFVKLKQTWDKKLKKSGFKDIEYPNGALRWDHMRDKKAAVCDESKAAYYRYAGHFLHEYEFASKKEQLIWDMHSQGISIRNITKALRSKRCKIWKEKVCHIIQELRDKMKEMYTLADDEELKVE